jgi:hypothetical protein
VAQLLTCPNNHHWDLTEHPFGILTRTHGLCPQCGEPPTADSPIDWEQVYRAYLLLLPILLVTLVAVSVPVFFVAAGSRHPGAWLCVTFCVALQVSAVVTDLVVDCRRAGQMREAARVLALDFLRFVSRARASELGLPPFLWKGFGFRTNGLHGRYQGTGIIFLDGWFRGLTGRNPAIQTAVVFLDPIPGLPDFRLESGRDERLRRNQSPEQRRGMHPLNPFRDEPFGRHYRLVAGSAGDVRPWLSPPLCAFLERQPGWVLGAWQGRFYLYRPGRRCRADACPTLLAVAWRLRGMLTPLGE